jgi:hypothetical protein
MLVALKKRLAPIDYAIEQKVIIEYSKLKKQDKGETVEAFLSSWEEVYGRALKLNLPEVQGVRPLFDFTQAIRSIDSGFASSQDFFIHQELRQGRTPDLYALIEDFRNTYRRTEAVKPTRSHSAFSTVKNQDGDQNGKQNTQPTQSAQGGQNNTKKCLCGLNHRFRECYHLNPRLRPNGWVCKQDTIDRINQKLDQPNNTAFKAQVILYGYDKATGQPTSQSTSQSTTESLNQQTSYKGISPQDDASNERHVAAYTTLYRTEHSAWSQSTHNLLAERWTLDGGSDVHVCNSASRNHFQVTRKAHPNDTLNAGKTTYQIEAWGTTLLNVETLNGDSQIRLLNVALCPGYMTNLVSMGILNAKGAHWSSERPDRLYETTGKTVCNLEKIGLHWVIKEPRPKAHAGYGTKKSAITPVAELTKWELHQALGHPGPKIIDKIPGAVQGLRIKPDSAPAPSTIDCDTCSRTKATEIVSRRTTVEDPTNGKPFDRVCWDMIQLEPAFNGDKWVSHFYCTDHLFHLVYTHARKSEAPEIMETAIALIKNSFGYDIRFIRLDGETALGTEYSNLVSSKGIKSERTAPDTPAQNGASERAGRTLTTKARSMIIGANLPTNLWPEAYKAAGYLANRTVVDKLDWKTPFESVKGYQPNYSHLHVFGCKAYALDHHIPRSRKLDPRAHVGYLVGYDSTNIFRIWIPTKGKVIRTRDVTFDHKSLYNPYDIDAASALRVAESQVQLIELPEAQSAGGVMQEDDEVFDTIIVDVPLSINPTNQRSDTTNQNTQKAISQQSQDESPKSTNLPTHLPTPDQTPDPSTDQNEGTEDCTAQAEPLAQEQIAEASSNTAIRRNEISGAFSEANIITGPRSRRRKAYVTALQNTNSLSGYYSAFASAYTTQSNTTRLHRDTLPPEPKSWKEMITHPQAQGFRQAADKEFNTLKAKKAFQYVKRDEFDVDPLPLTWVFKYKFDIEGHLVKYKARLCARGDLQTTNQDTYAATLAAQTFRAMMAITATYDLDIRQYDAVNAFVNADLIQPVLCRCPEGYEVPGQRHTEFVRQLGMVDIKDRIKGLNSFSIA